MELPREPNLITLSRQALLRGWMYDRNITYAELGTMLGITGDGLAKLVKQATIPTRHFEILVAQGVPPALLPEARDLKTGPKTKMFAVELPTAQA